MADEIHIIFRGKLPSRAAFNRAIKSLGYPVSLVDQKGPLEGQSGFMPMRLFREESGAEFDVFEGRDAVDELEPGVDPNLDRRASFRWRGSLDEAFLGYCGAVALARLTGGVILDEAEGRLVTIDEAVAAAKAILEARPPDTPRLGTRPADLKRYLKSLLKLRPDLILVGRMLVVRPVRHILRGAFLDRSGDKYSMTLWRYLKPLYEGPEGLGYGKPIHQSLWYVYEPYFQPLLLDVLREDVFSDLGQLTGMADLALYPAERYESHGPPIVELVLAGEHERATALVDEIERTKSGGSYWRHWAKTQRAFLSRKIDDVCGEFHAEEARAAKELKLDGLWEPSPFPVEVPKVERIERASERAFGTTPWIEPPPWLLGKVPEQPGDVRFAENEFERGDERVLLVPLTRETAEIRHQTRRNYVLAVRLANGDLVTVRHLTGWSPHDPVQPRNLDYVPTRSIYIAMYGSAFRFMAHFREDFGMPGILKMDDIYVYPAGTWRQIWVAHMYRGQNSVWDYRNGDVTQNRSMTEADFALCKFSLPPFGEFEEFLRRIERHLRNEGFGVPAWSLEEASGTAALTEMESAPRSPRS
jgi:hypothetical protein